MAVVAPLTATAQAQPVQSKSPYALPATKGLVGVDPNFLESMQKLADDREAKRNSFMENLKDATAWWSGGVHGPGEALSRRAKEREDFDATTFGMKRDIAQNRVAMEQAKGDASSLMQAVTGGGGVPGGGGAAGGAGQPPPLVAQEILRLLNSKPPRVEEAKARYNAWLTTETGNISKSTYGAAENTQQPTFIQGIGSIQLNPNQARAYENTGELPATLSQEIRDKAREIWQQSKPKAEGVLPHQKPLEKIGAPVEKPVTSVIPTASSVNANNVGNVRPIGSSTGFQQPKDMNQGLQIMDNNLKAYGDKGINTLEGVISRWAPPNENDTLALVKSAAQRLGIDPKQPIDLSNPAVRQAVGTAIMLQEKGPKGIFNAAPTENVSLPQQKAALQVNANIPFPNAKNPEEEKANAAEIAKRAAIPTEAASKEANTAAEVTGKELGASGQHKQQAADTIGAADRVINLADDKAYNKLMGYFEGGNKAATFAVKGLNWATAKLFGQEEWEKAIAALAFTPEERTRLNNLRTDATKLGIEYTAQMFKGARLGIGLEKLGSEGKGLSAGFTPQTNKLYAQITKDNAQFVLDTHKVFNNQWQAAHPGGTWGDFMRSKEYDVMLDNHLAKEQKLTAGSGIKLEKLSADQATNAEKESGGSFDKYVKKKQK